MRYVTAVALIGALWLMVGRAVAEVPGRGGPGVAGRAATASEPVDLGAALGESDTAINVGTKIGGMAPRFTLPDADGHAHTITPAGRPHVIIFHMGWI